MRHDVNRETTVLQRCYFSVLIYSRSEVSTHISERNAGTFILSGLAGLWPPRARYSIQYSYVTRNFGWGQRTRTSIRISPNTRH